MRGQEKELGASELMNDRSPIFLALGRNGQMQGSVKSGGHEAPMQCCPHRSLERQSQCYDTCHRGCLLMDTLRFVSLKLYLKEETEGQEKC